MITVTRPDLPPLEEYISYLKKIWSSHWLTNDGELLQSFEKELVNYLGVPNIVLTTNGTIALQAALKALDLKGEVITTPFTFAATTNVILWEGLTPVFADIDPDTFNIDPEDVERKITDRTCAILAVHVYGNPCYVERLQKIADQYGLKLIYDAAHAFGVEYKGRPVLEYGDISVLSFHATKVMNTIEGGALVVRDAKTKETVRLLVNHGIKSEEEVLLPGTNGKMSEFQAAMGLCNLRTVDKKIQLRENLYNNYKRTLGGIRSLKFQTVLASKYNYAYMPICLENRAMRDGLYDSLIRNDVKPRKYFYPLTVNFDYNRSMNLVEKYALHTALDVSDRVLCFPLYADLSIGEAGKVIGLIKNYVARQGYVAPVPTTVTTVPDS
jgi:dTDP-4-amino-4,6-dideoxygalactose transaminase